jgi:hypothetical protein
VADPLFKWNGAVGLTPDIAADVTGRHLHPINVRFVPVTGGTRNADVSATGTVTGLATGRRTQAQPSRPFKFTEGTNDRLDGDGFT